MEPVLGQNPSFITTTSNIKYTNATMWDRKCGTAWVCTDGLGCYPHPSLVARTKWEAVSIICDCRVMKGLGGLSITCCVYPLTEDEEFLHLSN